MIGRGFVHTSIQGGELLRVQKAGIQIQNQKLEIWPEIKRVYER